MWYLSGADYIDSDLCFIITNTETGQDKVIHEPDTNILGFTKEDSRWYCLDKFNLLYLDLIDDYEVINTPVTGRTNYFIWDKYGVLLKNFNNNRIMYAGDLVFLSIKLGYEKDGYVLLKSGNNRCIKYKLVSNWQFLYTKLLVLEKAL